MDDCERCVCQISGCMGRRVSSPFPHLLKDDDVVSCCLDLSAPCISFRVNGLPVQGMLENFNADGLLYPVVSFSAGIKWVDMFWLFGIHGYKSSFWLNTLYWIILLIYFKYWNNSEIPISELEGYNIYKRKVKGSQNHHMPYFCCISSFVYVIDNNIYGNCSSCFPFLEIRVRFLLGGRHGEFRFLPPPGFAPCSDALLPRTKLKVEPCQKYILNYGDGKQELIGPLVPVTPVIFTPSPVDISKVTVFVFVNWFVELNCGIIWTLSWNSAPTWCNF